MASFATVQDVLDLSGKNYTSGEQDRIEILLPLVSDALRYEAIKAGRNLDTMIAANDAYESVVKLVTVDVIIRVLRQSLEGEPVNQSSETALGYTWQGSYAIAGGGIAAAIMKNDLKRLGLRRQRYGWEDMYAPRDDSNAL